jgi:hypothetical protein
MHELRSSFRSDQLKLFRRLLERSSLVRELLGDLVEVKVIVDADKIQGELRWRLGSRRNPGARSALHEVIESGFLVPVVPLHLRTEIEDHLDEIAADTGASIEKARREWEHVQKLFHIYAPTASTQAPELIIDKDDVAYIQTSNELGLPVYSSDRHFRRTKVPLISISLDVTAREYVRAASITVGVTATSATTITVAFSGLMAFWRLLKKLAQFLAQLPKPVQITLAGLLTAALIFPRSRAKVLSGLGAIYQGAAKVPPEVLSFLAQLLGEFGSAWVTLQQSGQEIRSALPKLKRRSALMHMRAVLATSGKALSLSDLELQIRKEGYVSRAKDLKSYLRRVLRRSGQFLQVAPSTWALMANGCAHVPCGKQIT